MSIALFLNDVSGSEILLILMVVLLFFGSKSIPSIAKTLGKALYEFRNATSEIQNEIKKSGVDIQKDLNIGNLLKDTTEEITRPMDQVFTDIENTVHYGARNATEHLEEMSPTTTVVPPTTIPQPVSPIVDVDYNEEEEPPKTENINTNSDKTTE